MTDAPESGRSSPVASTGGVGIVLSGGGTRGIAHIGVLRALGERGWFPDVVAGTSAGAIVGALYAAGYGPAAMLEFFVRKNPFRLSKLSLSKPGIIDTDKVVADFEEYFPQNRFEALGRVLRVVATDLTEGRAVVFDSGPLIPALLASSAMPPMFSPVEIDGRVFADGGIVDNFPSGALDGRCRVRIGVHASPIGTREPSDLDSMFAVARRALEVGMYRVSEAKFPSCAVVVAPPGLATYGNLDTRHMAEVERVGYDAAVERMDAVEAAVRAG